MPSPKNVKVVAELTEQMKRAQSAVMADYRGLNSVETEALRAEAKKAGVEIRVRKNRLVKLALRDAKCQSMDKILTGPTLIGFGYEDPAAPAKLFLDFSKKNEKLKLKGAMIEGKAVDAEGAKQLATMPSKPEMLSRFLGSITSPVQKTAYAFNALQSKIAWALDAVRRQKEENGAA